MYELEEANLSHLRQKFKDYDIATISASRGDYSREKKKDKNTELKADLINSPYEVITIQGGYPETQNNGQIKDVKERSFFVVNYSNYDENKTKAFEDFMFDLCDKYNQDSIFIKTNNIPAGLYDKNREAVDFGSGQMINMNKFNSNPNQQYYSRINGSKFSFEEGKTIQMESKFEQLVYRVLQENGIDLKEWDDESELKYMSQHPDDHTGSYDIELQPDVPMNDNIRVLILKNNIVGEEDLKDADGNWLSLYPLDIKVDYSISGYPYDEEIEVDAVYLKLFDPKNNWVDITSYLPSEYLQKIAQNLEDSAGYIELHRA